MPDKTKKTVSASQIAALYGRSPYVTEWMLYQDFARIQPLPEAENERTHFGRAIEGVILNLASERLRLDVYPNTGDSYVPDAPIGCTMDAWCNCPSRGRGVVEAKNVDRLQWLTGWTETEAPVHIELQLQVQMSVLGADWGVIAVLVGGNELKIYERKPDKALIVDMRQRAMRFLASVQSKSPPPMDGVSIEIPQLDEMRVDEPEPTVKSLIDDQKASELIAEYLYWREKSAFASKNEARLKPKVLALGQDADAVRVHGHLLQIKRKKGPIDQPQLPKELVDGIVKYLGRRTRDPEAVQILTECMLWNGDPLATKITKRIVISKHDDGPTPWPNKWGLTDEG